MRASWSDCNSAVAVSVLLQSTNDVLSTCSAASNKTIKLGKHLVQKPSKNPEIAVAQAQVLRLSKLVSNLQSSTTSTESQIADAKKAVTAARSEYKRVTNAVAGQECYARDTLVHTVLSSNPRGLYKAIKSTNSQSSLAVQNLKVGSKTYSGSSVP